MNKIASVAIAATVGLAASGCGGGIFHKSTPLSGGGSAEYIEGNGPSLSVAVLCITRDRKRHCEPVKGKSVEHSVATAVAGSIIPTAISTIGGIHAAKQTSDTVGTVVQVLNQNQNGGSAGSISTSAAETSSTSNSTATNGAGGHDPFAVGS